MTKFTVSTKSQHAAFSVRARSYQHAAEIACRRLNGRSAIMVAIRTTGDAGKSGWFQGYRSDIRGGLNSTGSPFHVM